MRAPPQPLLIRVFCRGQDATRSEMPSGAALHPLVHRRGGFCGPHVQSPFFEGCFPEEPLWLWPRRRGRAAQGGTVQVSEGFASWFGWAQEAVLSASVSLAVE
jgi:hypothetical protein